VVSFAGLFGEGSIGEQLLVWGVLNELFGAALTPAVNEIIQSVNQVDTNAVLTPEQLAVAVVRQIVTNATGQSEAAKSGVGTDGFANLVALAQQPADLSLILQNARRQLGQVGPGMSVHLDMPQVLQDLGINPEYWPLINASVLVQPSAAEVLNAWLEGQIEETEAVARLNATGIDPTWIQTAYNSNGQAPTPTQALDMLNRGLIPATGTGPASISFQQAFLEGPWRNKWQPVFEQLRFYIPPPRTVTALLKEGAITESQATQYLADSGLDPTLTAIYLAAASHTTSATQRELTQAQIIDLYESKLLTEAEAQADLVALKFTATDAALLLALADQRQAASSVKSAVGRLQNLYLAGTNSVTVTQTSLHALGLSDANISNLIATWNLERTSKVASLTESQVVAAWFYGGFGTNDSPAAIATAVGRLGALGYSQADALLLLTARFHTPITMAGEASSPATTTTSS
jgi:hypothetical protein